jgi:peptidyl-prolyl cis-trans isomerase B (cyclophilin B)
MLVRWSAARALSCAAVAIFGLTVGACGDTAGRGSPTRTTPSQKGSASVAAQAVASRPGRCTAVQAPSSAKARRVHRPSLALDPAKRYLVTLVTNCGPIEIRLDVRHAPRTTASFAYLVERGFYDDLTFHRVAAGFVIQGGDPNGDGSGGPGYTVVERPPGDTRYTRGTVAMAKSETEPAGASGSQFFIVLAPDASLPPQYALVGNVVGGLAGVQAIARLPTDPPQDGSPKTPVVISHATLSAR